MLQEHDSGPVVQAWLIGINPEIDGQVPLRLLRDGELNTVGPTIRDAAGAFIAP